MFYESLYLFRGAAGIERREICQRNEHAVSGGDAYCALGLHRRDGGGNFGLDRLGESSAEPPDGLGRAVREAAELIQSSDGADF